MIQEIVDYLAKHGQMDQMYESLQRDDYSETVLAVLDVLIKTGQMPKLAKVTKCEKMSTIYRQKGNDKYQNNIHVEALIWYNNAILLAPNNSTALKLGYSNRSALLYKIKAYKACLNDIDTCFNVGPTDQSLADKLERGRRACHENISKNDKIFLSNRGTFAGTFFNFDVKRNPQIPCTSLDVGVVKETDKLKVVAVRNIEVGTLVALETAYACELVPDYKCVACSYCHKFDLNLIPCDKCCEVMFCSETCKVRCNNEFHNIECQIMHCIKFTQGGPSCRLKIKAAIKMRQKCSSWAEFAEASKNIGAERMKKSSVNEVYDVKNKFSMLCFDSDLHFLYGNLYNASMLTAMVIYYLLKVPSFFPETREDKNEAIQGFARVMINLCLFYKRVEILNHIMDPETGKIGNATPNHGWFSFTGKLNHCCDSNLAVLGLNNKVALVAIKPIKNGDELTISYKGHYFERIFFGPSFNLRPMALFCSNQILCNCRVCTERWSPLQYRKQKLNNQQRRAMSCFANKNVLQVEIFRTADMFKKICNALTALQDAPATEEHDQLFLQFRRFTSMCQVSYTDNLLPSV